MYIHVHVATCISTVTVPSYIIMHFCECIKIYYVYMYHIYHILRTYMYHIYVHVLLFFMMLHIIIECTLYIIYTLHIHTYTCTYEYDIKYVYIHVRLAGRQYWYILWLLPHAVECVLPFSCHSPAADATSETPPLLCTCIDIHVHVVHKLDQLILTDNVNSYFVFLF